MDLKINFDEFKQGGFKLAYFGFSSSPLSPHKDAGYKDQPALPICAKRSYYTVPSGDGTKVILQVCKSTSRLRGGGAVLDCCKCTS